MEDRMEHIMQQLQNEMKKQTSSIEHRVEDMQLEMSQLHAQNQVLLSKMSALSSQSSNAPQLFEGADRRNLKRKQEQLRSSGQTVAPAVRQLAFFDMEYPMWLVPVSTLLQFEYLPSHQEALAKGMLVQYTSEIAGRVIFVSHEWLSLGHVSHEIDCSRARLMYHDSSYPRGLKQADPDGEQLRELQRLLIRMMKGEVNAQQPKVVSNSGVHVKEETTREEWAASLPFSFVWLDFISIPQPCMEPETGEATAQDHRHAISSASKSAHQLALAVNSIPAYARASSLMCVLTPFIRHKDRGKVCSFRSWRKRGWCRLEVMAAKLATHDLRVIACNGGEATPVYLRMTEITGLFVGKGDYTCCACDHDFGTGLKVRCDKTKVWPVLARMLNDAARYYKQNGDMFGARFMLSSSYMFENLPRPPDADFTLSYGCGSLSEWKKRLWVSDRGEDWEKAFVKETKWTTLHSLAWSASLKAVQEYVNQPSFNPSSIFLVSKANQQHTAPAATPLQLAMFCPSFEIASVLLQKLDEAGLREKVEERKIEIVTASGLFKRSGNTRKWLQLFASHSQPQKTLTLLARLGDAACVQALVETGADPDAATDLLHTAAQNADDGGEIARYLLSVSPNLINKVKKTAPPKALTATAAAAVAPKHTQPRSSWFGRLLLPKKKNAYVAPAASSSATAASSSTVAQPVGDEMAGDSPLHSAIRWNNIGLMIELLKHQPDGINADLSLRNKMGLTASELVKEQYNNTAPPVLSELLRSAAYYNAKSLGGGAGGRANKHGTGRSAEITRTEMEDTIRTMADAMKAKDEAMRAKDDTMRAKDEQMADAMRAKDEQMANAVRAKDRELNDTIKTMTESMRAMEAKVNSLQSSLAALGAGSSIAGLGGPASADIAL